MFALGECLWFFFYYFISYSTTGKEERTDERKAFPLATHYSFPLLNNAIYYILPIFQKCCLCSFFLTWALMSVQLFKTQFIGLRANDYTFEINCFFSAVRTAFRNVTDTIHIQYSSCVIPFTSVLEIWSELAS